MIDAHFEEMRAIMKAYFEEMRAVIKEYLGTTEAKKEPASEEPKAVAETE
jgi:hypothetical protein